MDFPGGAEASWLHAWLQRETKRPSPYGMASRAVAFVRLSPGEPRRTRTYNPLIKSRRECRPLLSVHARLRSFSALLVARGRQRTRAVAVKVAVSVVSKASCSARPLGWLSAMPACKIAGIPCLTPALITAVVPPVEARASFVCIRGIGLFAPGAVEDSGWRGNGCR